MVEQLQHGSTIQFHRMDRILVKEQDVHLDQIGQTLRQHFRSMSHVSDTQLLVSLIRKPTDSNCNITSMLGPNLSSSDFSMLDYFRLALFKYRQYVMIFKNDMKVSVADGGARGEGCVVCVCTEEGGRYT